MTPVSIRSRGHLASGPWVLFLPALVLAGLGWSYRWTGDDGFIYLRVVENLLAGNGPVFNAGERVEVGTSPVWVLLLAVFRVASGLSLELIAVILGLLLSTGGVLLAVFALRQHRREAVLAMLVFVSIPFVGHFATSGLETGLVLGWLGWCVPHVFDAFRTPPTNRGVARTGVVLGLGPLIRPDLALIGGVLLAGVWWNLRHEKPGQLGRLLISASILPLSYQVFRMGYFRAALPLTAVTKEAGMSYWSQGSAYLLDTLVSPGALVVITTGLIGLLVTRDRAFRWLGLAAVVYGLAVVRGGGDFMRMRLLLPTMFLLTVVSAEFTGWKGRVLPLLLMLVVIPVGMLEGQSFYSIVGAPYVHSERNSYPLLASMPNPVRLSDFSEVWLVEAGVVAAERVNTGGKGYWELGFHGAVDEIQANPPASVAIASGPIGLVGYSAGLDVFIIDRFSLADPIGARLELGERARPGHEKYQPRPWLDARAGIPSPDGLVAAAATRCGWLGRHLDGIRSPLTGELFFENLRAAVGDTFRRIPADPQEAFDRLCTG